MRLNLEHTLLDEVTDNTVGDEKSVELYNTITFQAIGTSITTGANVLIEASLDGTNFVTYETLELTEDGSKMYSINDAKLKYVRASVSSYTDGEYTVLLMAGV